MQHYCVIYAYHTILGTLATCFSFANADNRFQLGVFVGVLMPETITGEWLVEPELRRNRRMARVI